MSLSQEDLEVWRSDAERLTGYLRGEPLFQHVRDELEARGCSPSSSYLCVYQENEEGGERGLVVCGDGTVVSFELADGKWLSWTEHSRLGGLAKEFSGTEYVFALSKELRRIG